MKNFDYGSLSLVTPLESMINLEKRLDEFWVGQSFETGAKGFTPKVEIMETESELWVRFDLAGFNKNDLSLEIHDQRIYLSGVKQRHKIHGEVKVRYSEFPYGEFQRTVKLPVACDPENAKAECVKGILTVRIAKVEFSRPREVIIS
jgi:HSP20 family protein